MSRKSQLQNESFLVNRLRTRERDEERENWAKYFSHQLLPCFPKIECDIYPLFETSPISPSIHNALQPR